MVTNFYGGRTPMTPSASGVSGRRIEDPRQNSMAVGRGFFNGVPQQQRSFSALNYAPIDDKNYSAIYGNSSDPIKRNSSALATAPSNRNQINTANNRFSAISDKGGSTPPPNFKNNLLNYVFSPEGKGMAQGLLEASGYSDTPISFGQALAMGMKRGNEAKASASASQLAQDKFNYQKEQDILNRQLAYAQIKPASVPALQQNIRAMLEGQGLKPGTPEYDVAFANAINDYLTKSSGTTVDIGGINLKAEGKGTEQMYINAANRNDASFTKIQTTAGLASDQNISIDSMMRIMRNMNDSDFGTFGTTKLYLKQFAKQLGLNDSEISSPEVFYSLAGDFVMGQIAKTKGAISNKEMAYFEMISPGLSRSKQGNILQLQLAKEVNKFHIDLEGKRADFQMLAAEKGWNSIQTEAEWIKESKRLYADNTVIGNLEKKMENNIINQANAMAKENNIQLVFNPSSAEDKTLIQNQIQTYYDKTDSSKVIGMQLVGYTDEGYLEYMVDLGNDRYEKRTIKTNLGKE
tara:strand:- start:2001 stop:3560 length:1560 start_codon:yes stop_codon:yes gene_type:complete